MFFGQPKNIVICITGGIAAYKSLSLIRLFKAANCQVKVIATANALRFVTRLTIETLSQNTLYYDTFQDHKPDDVHHISLADWADTVIIAPATANIIGKYCHGIADDALSSFLLAVHKPTFWAPAMNNNMYESKVVQENITLLKKHGGIIIEPQEGFLACGTEGKGRMEEPERIFNFVNQYFTENKKWSGKKVLITAGPTYEPIDPVRFIGNRSSGRMGFALAEVLRDQGAEVTLVVGATDLKPPTVAHCIHVSTAAQMFDACISTAPIMDLVIMSAAVTDYTPLSVASEKIKKNEQQWQISLTKTKDILAELGKQKPPHQYLIGFALETENELENAHLKLHNKNADMIVLNSAKNKNTGFQCMTNQVTILTKTGLKINTDLALKSEIAAKIANTAFDDFFVQ